MKGTSPMLEQHSHVTHGRLEAQHTDGESARPRRSAARWIKAGLEDSGDDGERSAGRRSSNRSDGEQSGRGCDLAAAVAALVDNPSAASEVPIDRIPAL